MRLDIPRHERQMFSLARLARSRRGPGSNLHVLGVADRTIQMILRHANLSTTMGYYISPHQPMQLPR